jgi:hypothetical protein
MSTEDWSTKLIRDITKVFLVQHPLRLAGCVCLGVVLNGLVNILQFSHPEVLWLAGAAKQPLLFYITLAIVGGFSTLFIKPPELPEAPLIRLIEALMKNGNISEVDRRRFFRALIQKCIDAFSPDQSKREIDKILTPEEIKDLTQQ